MNLSTAGLRKYDDEKLAMIDAPNATEIYLLRKSNND